MTDITVSSTVSHVENRSWLLSQHGTEPGTTPSVTLDVPKFAGLHPNGFIPSGIVLGKITASKLYAPYDSAATDGSEVAAGLLFGSLAVREGSVKIGGAAVVHGFVNPAKLPLATGKGSLSAAARTALNLIHFSA